VWRDKTEQIGGNPQDSKKSETQDATTDVLTNIDIEQNLILSHSTASPLAHRKSIIVGVCVVCAAGDGDEMMMMHYLLLVPRKRFEMGR